MKKERNTELPSGKFDDLRAEYEFDYGKAKPNRFAAHVEKKRVIVALETDVAEVFTTPESVNEVLRALIRTMPSMSRRKTRT